MPYIQFSLPQSDAERIAELSQEDESLGLACKRLILEIIGGDRQSSPMPPDLGDRLTNLEKQLAHVTEQVEARFRLCSQDGDRLEKIESRLEKLDLGKGLSTDELHELAALLARDYWGDGQGLDHLCDLENRLSKIERAIAESPQETAIMMQKQPLPPAEIPLKTQIALRTEIARTHEEVALAWEKSVSTVKRWAKDPDKWPEGWIYDGDRNFWVKPTN